MDSTPTSLPFATRLPRLRPRRPAFRRAVPALALVLSALGGLPRLAAAADCTALQSQLSDLETQRAEAQQDLTGSACAGAAKAGCLRLVTGLTQQISALQAQIRAGNCPSSSTPPPPPTPCPSPRPVVEIKTNDQRAQLIAALNGGNVDIQLGPDIDMSFDDAPVPIAVGRCTSLTSVQRFLTLPSGPRPGPIQVERFNAAAALTASAPPPAASARLSNAPFASARTARTPGPVLRYGRSRGSTGHFLDIFCTGAGPDGIRLAGFRVFGPSLGEQSTGEVGIEINNCHDAEISNLEVAGWGGAAIQVENTALGNDTAAQHRIRIHDNYLHDNKHPSSDDHAAGYGINVGAGGWATLEQNVLDNNRHSITANGHSGGYDASRNLVLKGGGYHNGTFLGVRYEKYIHVLDVHGTDNCNTFSSAAWNCGDAGKTFNFLDNSVQYTKTTDLKIRGRPLNHATIARNVFARSDEDAAIDLQTAEHVTVGDNLYNVDGYGHYGVCDFDGDGVDDLFLATGVTWWFSSLGEFNWTYLNAQTATLPNVRLGYFDGDAKCDVLAENPAGSGQWFISSGGTSAWKPLGAFGHPLSEVQFGRFDPAVTDTQPGATRQTTHAFWRRADGAWFVTSLTAPLWTQIGSSSFPLNQLRFGDFSGHGRTDVLAVQDGHWSISEDGRQPWRTLNASLHDPVENLFIANMDADDNIDDLLRLERRTYTDVNLNEGVELTWWRSRNGTGPWTVWKTYTFSYPRDAEHWSVQYGFAGRFGTAPGGGTMVIDDGRIGRFFSAAEQAAGASSEWSSTVPY